MMNEIGAVKYLECSALKKKVNNYYVVDYEFSDLIFL